MYPNEIIQLVKLPEHLANHPYLIEYYGTVEWSVKAVFTNYMGWFSGKASELHPLPYKEEALLMVIFFSFFSRRSFMNANPVNFVFVWVPITGIRW